MFDIASRARRVVLALFCSLSFSLAVFAEPPCLSISGIPKFGDVTKVIENARKIFDAAGICARFSALPLRRSEQLLLDGKLDGELLRTDVWAEMFKAYAVAVPTPLHRDRMMALSLQTRKRSFGKLEDLKGYRVMIIGGHRWAEVKTKALGIEAVPATTQERFVALVRLGRVDVGLVEESLLPLLEDDSGIQVEPIAAIYYHIVLRREHEGLVSALDKALKDFLSNGEPRYW